jgi:hypothetical protein
MMINQRMHVALWVILTMSLGSIVSAEESYDQEEVKAQIRESSQTWATVLVTGDTSPLETLLADDMVGTAPNGRLYTKREFIEFTKENPPGLKSNNVNDVKIRFFGQVAVAQGSETFVFQDGKMKRAVWTDIYELRDEQWVIVAAQDVLVEETSEPPQEDLF